MWSRHTAKTKNEPDHTWNASVKRWAFANVNVIAQQCRSAVPMVVYRMFSCGDRGKGRSDGNDDLDTTLIMQDRTQESGLV